MREEVSECGRRFAQTRRRCFVDSVPFSATRCQLHTEQAVPADGDVGVRPPVPLRAPSARYLHDQPVVFRTALHSTGGVRRRDYGSQITHRWTRFTARSPTVLVSILVPHWYWYWYYVSIGINNIAVLVLILGVVQNCQHLWKRTGGTLGGEGLETTVRFFL